MEKELESRTAAMVLQVQQQVDQKVPEATREALQENMEVKARFDQLSHKAKGLMVQNASLRGSESRLRADLDVLEQALSEMSRTSCTRKKARLFVCCRFTTDAMFVFSLSEATCSVFSLPPGGGAAYGKVSGAAGGAECLQAAAGASSDPTRRSPG